MSTCQQVRVGLSARSLAMSNQCKFGELSSGTEQPVQVFAFCWGFFFFGGGGYLLATSNQCKLGRRLSSGRKLGNGMSETWHRWTLLIVTSINVLSLLAQR